MIALFVVFVIVCILVVGLVLLQNEEGGGLGGLFGSGGGSAAFGSRSASVLTKTTYVLVILFFVASLGLALMNKAPSIKAPVAPATEQDAASSDWWQGTSQAPAASEQTLSANETVTDTAAGN